MPIRLTLRSMLNYMDDVLEPADATDIANAIDKSEFATNLMHRIRDVTKRLRLAAPKVEGRGMGLDPNTVAEYLDNTLHGDRVPEFEKVCLESDVHLAEIAAVHQVLTLVLGEPAEIDPVSRMRMYALIEDLDKLSAPQHAPQPAPLTTKVTVTAAATTAPMAASADSLTSKAKLEVPDYLRDAPKQRSMAGIIAVAACLLLLVGGGVALVANRDTLMDAFGLKPKEVAQGGPHVPAPGEGAPTVPGASGDKPATIDGATTPTTDGNTTPMPPVTPAGTNTTTVPGAATPNPPVTAPALTNPEDKRPAPAVPVVAPDKSQVPPAPEPSAPGVEKPAMKPGDTTKPVDTVPPAATVPAATTDTAAKPDATKPDATKPEAAKPAPEPPVPPQEIGRLISEKEVLLRMDRATKSYKRLAAASLVATGDQLMALPAYRPEVALSMGVSMRLFGEAAVELLPPDRNGVAGVRLVYGRIRLLTAGRPDVKLRLHAGDRQGLLTFGNADTTVALEVQFRHKDGTDPEIEPAHVQVDLYAASGDVQWQDGSSPQPETVTAPALRVLSGQSPGASPLVAGAEHVAAWVNKDDRVGYEKLASAVVEEELARPERANAVVLGLRELAVNPRVEVKLLAETCLAHLGDFELILASLRDETQKAYWLGPRGQIETLQEALARGPVAATAIRDSLITHRGPEKGTDLYRLLWGYNLEQLQVSGAPQLVKWLDHQDLDYRVLSFANLVKATGSTLGYRPEFTQAQRKTSLQTFDTRLKSGQLLPKQ